MKSPWKFLAQLASRTWSSGEDESTREAEAADRSARVVSAANTAAMHVSHADHASDESESDRNSLTVETADAEDPAEATSTIERKNEPEPATDRLLPLQSKAAKRKNKTRKTRGSGTPVEAVKLGASSGPPAISSFEHAMVLDDEIKQLRRQLAEKLRLQNADLKKMLARFEKS